MPNELDSTPVAQLSYLDFELEIGPGIGRDYPLTVFKSPAGEAQATMRFPFDDLALNDRLKDLQIALMRSGGARRQALLPEEQSVQDFGGTLLDALLAGEVRSRFDVSRGQARQQGKGLRLKLRIQAPELAALPWEFLFDPRQAEFVCLSRRTPIVRYLELPQSVEPLQVATPLRILGLIARPCDLQPLDVEREQQRLEEALKGLTARGAIQLEWLPGQTWRDLQRVLRGGPWHILHFVGHGGFNASADEGFIMFSDEMGHSHMVYASELGRLLADHDPLRLVVLNSCEGARGGARDIFSSTASILIRHGLPAVLAMQYEISDRAAVEFSRSFYEALADGYPVDASVAEARKAVSMAVENTMEWGTPVLYMRSPDGVLFDLQVPPINPATGPSSVRPLAQAPTPIPPKVTFRAQEGSQSPPMPPRVPPSSMGKPQRNTPWSAIALVLLAILVLAIGVHEFWPSSPTPGAPQTAIPTPTSSFTTVQTKEPPSSDSATATSPTLPSHEPTPTWTPTPTPTWTPTPTPTWTPTPAPVILSKTSFVLPYDGAPNNNGAIGPFCCTGRTATVTTNGGAPVGYVYFYNWKGQAYNVGDSSIAPDVQILVSGLADASNVDSAQVQSSIDFQAAELQPGFTRSAIAGDLDYTVTIENVELVDYNGAPYFDMPSLVVRVYVALP